MKTSSRLIKLILTLSIIFSAQSIGADQSEPNSAEARANYIRDHYTKFEYQIPMRDGVKLFTSVYLPNDRSKSYPVMLVRTPYAVGPYGADRYKKHLGPTAAYEKEGFIFAFQDVRGKYMSEGEFVNMRPQDAYKRGKNATDDATDSYDSIEWLTANLANNNGKVGIWGSSYPGYYSSVATINSHKALKAVSPQAPIADWFFDDFHRNGAFVTPMAFLFFHSFDKARPQPQAHSAPRMELPTPDGYEFFKDLGPLSNVNKQYFKGERPFWNDLVNHPNYDQYWQDRNILPHLNNTKPATLVVGGWYDTEDLYGPFATYKTMSKDNNKDHIRLVIGPWHHGQWYRDSGQQLGEANFGSHTSDWFQDNIQLPFFKHHLKDGPKPSLSTATMFETGANRWRYFDQWPPKAVQQQKLLLAANESLKLDTNEGHSKGHSEGYSEYISDPNKPVPFSATTNNGWSRPYMVEDQRYAARRTDVLVFNAEPAKQDQTLAGPIEVDLWVSTSQSAADFVVKLVDVFPGVDANSNKADPAQGHRHELVRWGVIRGRFRNSFSRPEPFEPNQPTRISFKLDDVLHNIKRGHTLQIQIQSSFFPFIDLNPQKYVDNIFEAKEEDFVKATHKIYHNRKHPSSVTFGVLKD